mmetsp:Transcript_30491/g.42063  ORF Transcript_30491/g.42063 Transcript_30491/m.42063 type:complete len:136 (+) Transcript_30491:130-537(+)
MELVEHHGGCHCGHVRFVAKANDNLKAYKCNCSICKMKANVHFVVPKDQFRIVKGEDELTEYRFNTKQARHLFCKHCGVQSFYVPRSNPDGYGITLGCVDEGTIKSVEIVEYDGVNWESQFEKSDIRLDSVTKGK